MNDAFFVPFVTLNFTHETHEHGIYNTCGAKFPQQKTKYIFKNYYCYSNQMYIAKLCYVLYIRII